MFNERVLEFEGGAFSPRRKGAQPKNITKIIEQQRFCHLWYRSRRVTATNALNEQSRRISVWNSLDDSGRPGSADALAKPEANAYLSSP
ncbi:MULTISPECIES: hypothetical protein [unclassified Caulobacter]|uniref:hypothetical protein n=1 Tax=unclassified Caulobacter TaxID=2648921 RepID=UPI000AB36884|nr:MULTISPECIES: hypothetical protein [unclassified Caulobacter]